MEVSSQRSVPRTASDMSEAPQTLFPAVLAGAPHGCEHVAEHPVDSVHRSAGQCPRSKLLPAFCQELRMEVKKTHWSILQTACDTSEALRTHFHGVMAGASAS